MYCKKTRGLVWWIIRIASVNVKIALWTISTKLTIDSGTSLLWWEGSKAGLALMWWRGVVGDWSWWFCIVLLVTRCIITHLKSWLVDQWGFSQEGEMSRESRPARKIRIFNPFIHYNILLFQTQLFTFEVTFGVPHSLVAISRVESL